MARRWARAIAVGALCAGLASGALARATASDEQDFISRINAERAARGIAAVTSQNDLSQIARAWSAHMAARGELSHDPNITSEVSGWTALGDVVGMGSTVAKVHNAFMATDEHRTIILGTRFTQVGVGVAYASGAMYVTEIFADRASTHVAPAPAPRRPSGPVSRAAQRSLARAALAETIWRTDLPATPLTVAYLVRLVSLDASRVDPATGRALALR